MQNDSYPETTVDSTSQLSENQNSEQSILKAFDTSVKQANEPAVVAYDPARPANQPSTSMKKTKIPAFAIFALVAILAGIGTGYGGFKLQTKSSTTGPGGSGAIQQVAEGSVKAGDVFGVDDENTFTDSTEGYLEIGGLDGEGSHKLLRPGGASQTVYLTSSITDLDKFDGMEVKIWGETFKGQKAGWLMDVGRVQVTNVKGTAPSEE